jgi:oligopeptidase A
MNPFLDTAGPIAFDQMAAGHIVPAVREAVQRADARIAGLLSVRPRTYAATLAPLDEALEQVARVAAVASHLNNFVQNDAIRAAYVEAEPVLSDFQARFGTSAGLLALVEEVLEVETGLSAVQRRHAEVLRRELRLGGAHLGESERSRLQQLHVELGTLSTEFGNNVLDATNAFELLIEDTADLHGLPDRFVRQAAAAAGDRGLDGWLVTLHQPSYQPFMTYSRRRALRQRLKTAYDARAAGPPQDNRPVLQRILVLRQEIAGILGCASWAEYVAQDSMAGSPVRALKLIRDLTQRTAPYFEREKAEIGRIAAAEGIEVVEPWDVLFLNELYRQEACALDEEELRPYFELGRVMRGMFGLAERLFDVEIRPAAAPVWHESVQAFEFVRGGQRVALLYTDWFPRASKRGGAWMSPLRTGGPLPGGGVEPHVAVISGNFTPPGQGGVSLLSHDEVTTLFHEFGHALHAALSEVPVRSLSGTNVYTDWVEVPSQLMENWVWERQSLDRFAAHHETGEPIPESLFERLRASRTHLGGYDQMRQLGFASLDMALHAEPVADSYEGTLRRAQDAAAPFQLRPEFARNEFINSFTHLFGSGYAARYYSYKWSEVLEADLFGRFLEEGIESRSVGTAFARSILARGNADEPDELFRAFMGRGPDPEALIRRNLGAPRGASAGTPGAQPAADRLARPDR